MITTPGRMLDGTLLGWVLAMSFAWLDIVASTPQNRVRFPARTLERREKRSPRVIGLTGSHGSEGGREGRKPVSRTLGRIETIDGSVERSSSHVHPGAFVVAIRVVRPGIRQIRHSEVLEACERGNSCTPPLP